MRFLGSFVVLVFLSSCSGPKPKSSEEKAAEMTRELLKEMHEQDSLEALRADSLK
jgi:hypothetical protein